jgi:NADP-dependent 3-hydroxy acid dehydrogenase YdfG
MRQKLPVSERILPKVVGFKRDTIMQRHHAIQQAQSANACVAYLSHSSMGVYAGLKQAVEVFSTFLRVELNGSGVRVGTIALVTTEAVIFDRQRVSGQMVRADQTPALQPLDVASSVRYMLE